MPEPEPKWELEPGAPGVEQWMELGLGTGSVAPRAVQAQGMEQGPSSARLALNLALGAGWASMNPR